MQKPKIGIFDLHLRLIAFFWKSTCWQSGSFSYGIPQMVFWITKWTKFLNSAHPKTLQSTCVKDFYHFWTCLTPPPKSQFTNRTLNSNFSIIYKTMYISTSNFRSPIRRFTFWLYKRSNFHAGEGLGCAVPGPWWKFKKSDNVAFVYRFQGFRRYQFQIFGLFLT